VVLEDPTVLLEIMLLFLLDLVEEVLEEVVQHLFMEVKVVPVL
jgi:hypothetical protein